MKILYLSPGVGQDYLRDCVFHGLRTLLGAEIVDYPKIDSMYIGADRSQMYGRGFTLYGEMPDIEVDRSDIPAKIANRYFDIIVYGSIHRCQDYLAEVVSKYPPSHIVAIDGEDHPGYLNGLGFQWYFKRELYNPQPNVYPIQFTIPKQKILSSPKTKTRMMAPCDPINRNSYIYKTEEEYYAQYAESYYGATMMKAGWDCMRHYEILSQWCMPYFRVFNILFDRYPLICEHLPRPEIELARLRVEYWARTKSDIAYAILIALWDSIMEPVMKVVREKMTTEALALRVFDTIGVTTKVHSVPPESVNAL